MITIKIKENSKQGKLFVEYAKSLSFVEVQDPQFDPSKKNTTKSKSAIEISLDEENKGKINSYKNSTDLFN